MPMPTVRSRSKICKGNPNGTRKTKDWKGFVKSMSFKYGVKGWGTDRWLEWGWSL